MRWSHHYSHLHIPETYFDLLLSVLYVWPTLLVHTCLHTNFIDLTGTILDCIFAESGRGSFIMSTHEYLHSTLHLIHKCLALDIFYVVSSLIILGEKLKSLLEMTKLSAVCNSEGLLQGHLLLSVSWNFHDNRKME